MYMTVSVLQGNKRILPWKMFLCSEEHTFVSLFEDIRKDLPESDEGSEAKRIIRCSLSKSIDCTQSVMIELGFNVLECCSLNRQFVQYNVEERDHNCGTSSQQDTFTVLMTSAKKPRLPPKLLTPGKYDSG